MNAKKNALGLFLSLIAANVASAAVSVPLDTLANTGRAYFSVTERYVDIETDVTLLTVNTSRDLYGALRSEILHQIGLSEVWVKIRRQASNSDGIAQIADPVSGPGMRQVDPKVRDSLRDALNDALKEDDTLELYSAEISGEAYGYASIVYSPKTREALLLLAVDPLGSGGYSD
jgi:hypothetical protein